MTDLLNVQGEAFSRERFRCPNCRNEFEAAVVTWVDVSKTPRTRRALLDWKFNIIQCGRCGCRHFSATPFFYEDFELGLLVAVFPRVPGDRGEIERTIRERFGYYPALEFFYDMTQLWMLLYFQEQYKTNRNLRALSRLGDGDERLRKMLRFLKQHDLMIDIRERLTESFFGSDANDDLAETLEQALYTLEEMLPWPLDRRCRCGADLSRAFNCCGKPIGITAHERLFSRHYNIYCPNCAKAVAGASCGTCGRVYSWKVGTVPSFDIDGPQEPATGTVQEGRPQKDSM